MRRSNLALAAVLCGSVALGQAGPSFDVVAIHELDPNGGMIIVDPYDSPVSSGAYTERAASLTGLISFAYNIKLPGLYLSGVPNWARNVSYSVQAKAGTDYKPGTVAENNEQVRLMVRQMLAERFQLKMHSETRAATILNMEATKGGVRVPEVPAPVPPEREGFVSMSAGDRGGRMIGTKSTMAGIATALSIFFRQPVVDTTGLKGHYDFNLQWTAPDRTTASSGLGPDGLALLISMLDDQVGLVLKKASGSMQVWVVDGVERPSGN